MDPTVYKIKELNIDLIRPHTADFQDPESYGSKIVVIGKPGCFTAGTKILMFDGTLKNVEDVQVGDKIMGDDSTVRNVIELCHNTDEMFKIVPKFGESYTVNKQHKLVLSSNSRKNEITVENYLKESDEFKSVMKIYRTGVEFASTNLPLDPYDFGIWLSKDNPEPSILPKYNLENNKHIPHDFKVNSQKNRLFYLLVF